MLLNFKRRTENDRQTLGLHLQLPEEVQPGRRLHLLGVKVKGEDEDSDHHGGHDLQRNLVVYQTPGTHTQTNGLMNETGSNKHRQRCCTRISKYFKEESDTNKLLSKSRLISVSICCQRVIIRFISVATNNAAGLIDDGAAMKPAVGLTLCRYLVCCEGRNRRRADQT